MFWERRRNVEKDTKNGAARWNEKREAKDGYNEGEYAGGLCNRGRCK